MARFGRAFPLPRRLAAPAQVPPPGSPVTGAAAGTGEVSGSKAGQAAAAGVVSATGQVSGSKAASGSFAGVVSGTGAAALPTAVQIVNQWAGTFARPASLGPVPPALQSLVVALTPANSVGRGTGTPSSGNWLFCITGWNQGGGLPAVTAGDCDDVHSFWRPGNVTTSQWAVSPSAGATRTNVWYTANLARAPGDVFAAPSGVTAGMACLVIEVSGLGPWDVVTGIAAAYAAAATNLTLALPAPGNASFTLAAATGDLSTAGQSLAPAGWTTLATVTATDGSDHVCDTVLTSAVLPSTSTAVSVNATASSATDLSGVIIAVQIGAPSPIPAGANPAWPGRFVVEMAFNGGFETPQDQLQWTVVTDNAWQPGQGIKRVWGLSDDTGVPYMLGQLQSGTGSWQLDNFDGALSPARVGPSGPWSFTIEGGGGPILDEAGNPILDEAGNPILDEGAVPASPAFFTVTTAQAASVSAGQAFTDVQNPGTLFVVSSVGAASGGYVDVQFSPAPANGVTAGDVVTQINPVTGVPVRLRAALGTVTTRDSTVTYNRWYVLARHALKWPEQRNPALRNFVPLAVSDIWAAASLPACPTPYRGEVAQDNPYAQWTCDDQPGTANVLPTSLLNSAPGNSNRLAIVAPPAGTLAQQVDTTGAQTTLATSCGLYQVAASSGWMPGDPPSGLSAAAAATGNPVTASPGSAAWQASGQYGTSGSHGWVLLCNDPGFPPLASGITVEGWFNYTWAGSAAGFLIDFPPNVFTFYNWQGQPVGPLTLITLATSSHPVAVLQLDGNGHLNLITYAGSSGTSHSVYSASDLRALTWFKVKMDLTTTTWAVSINGGQTAAVSGTAAGMTSAWTWFAANGDFGSGGGSATGAGLVHSGNVQISHLAVYPQILPAYRERAHYWAAITGHGQIPAPTGTQFATAVNAVAQDQGPVNYTPDGASSGGSYGTTGGGSGVAAYTLAAIIVAEAGGYTSGPSAWAITNGAGQNISGDDPPHYTGPSIYISWSGVAPAFGVYTSGQVATEANAATVVSNADSFFAGYGSGASGIGPGQTAAGTGAAYPTAASAIGDTVAQRVERVLGYAGITRPLRGIDPAASLLVQAAGDVGGQQAGASMQNMVNSDNGLMYIGTDSAQRYRSRARLAADVAAGPVWFVGMNVPTSQPFGLPITYPNDPQRIYTDITVTPYSPSGASLPVIVPSNAAAVKAAQLQSGARPLNVVSYLQSSAEQQSQANWLFATYGQNARRAEKVTIDAASHPAAWALFLGANVSDIAQLFDAPIGAPSTTGQFRVTKAERNLSFGANQLGVKATITLTLDPLPASYWT